MLEENNVDDDVVSTLVVGWLLVEDFNPTVKHIAGDKDIMS